MEIKQLVTFYAVAQSLSFSQAAVDLNYAQPTITTHIQILEQELGVPLFDRLGKKITLTTAGERLLSYAEHLIRIEGEARSVIVNSAAEPVGDLLIAASGSLMSYHLPPIIEAYKHQFPAVNLRIMASVLNQDLVQAVTQGEFDMGLVYRQVLPDTVDFIKLMDETLLLACSAAHPLAQSGRLELSELPYHTILFMAHSCPLRNVFDQILDQHQIRISPDIEFNDYDTLKRYTKMGTGVALFPVAVIQEEMQRGEIVSLDWLGNELTMPIWLIWHREKWMSPAVTAFRDMVVEMLGCDVFASIQ